MMKIIFYGTPEIASFSLNAILKAGFDVAAVVTMPDKLIGRGQKLGLSDVKKFALAHNIPVLQPEKLKSPDFLAKINEIKPDVQVVVAFRMMPKEVWNMPKFGTINLHTSLLPDYRGAAPINHVIINGEKETGVTIFKLNENIDEGDVFAREKIDIEKDETAGTLHDKLMIKGTALLIETLKNIENGRATAINQNLIKKENLHLAPKIFKEDCIINWNNPAQKVLNLIRGLSPYPTAFVKLSDDEILKIFNAEISEKTFPEKEIGDFISDNKKFLLVKCQDYSISITDLQLSGKKRMNIEDFLRGYKFNNKIND